MGDHACVYVGCLGSRGVVPSCGLDVDNELDTREPMNQIIEMVLYRFSYGDLAY